MNTGWAMLKEIITFNIVHFFVSLQFQVAYKFIKTLHINGSYCVYTFIK